MATAGAASRLHGRLPMREREADRRDRWSAAHHRCRIRSAPHRGAGAHGTSRAPFHNEEVVGDIDRVLERIAAAALRGPAAGPSPLPLSHSGEGFRIRALLMTRTRIDNARVIRSPRGPELSAKSWLTEAPLRMLMNNLDPEVAEQPARARRLRRHRPGGARLGELRPHRRGAARARGRRDAAGAVGQAGRRVPHPRRRAARADRELEPRAALGDLGALPRARSQGPDDVRPDDGRLVDLHRHARASCRAPTRPSPRSGGSTTAATLPARWILTGGLGGMGGAQPLAATMAGASMLAVECQPSPHRDAAAHALPRPAGRATSTRRWR